MSLSNTNPAGNLPRRSRLNALLALGWLLITGAVAVALYQIWFRMTDQGFMPCDGFGRQTDTYNGGVKYPILRIVDCGWWSSPPIPWWLVFVLGIPGAILAMWASSRISYWYKEVMSGVVVNKDLMWSGFLFGGVDPCLYVRGPTRAGTCATIRYSVSHGTYEQHRVGSKIVF